MTADNTSNIKMLLQLNYTNFTMTRMYELTQLMLQFEERSTLPKFYSLLQIVEVMVASLEDMNYAYCYDHSWSSAIEQFAKHVVSCITDPTSDFMIVNNIDIAELRGAYKTMARRGFL